MNLSQRDNRHIWHPLTQHQTAALPRGIVRARGALLFDEDGNEIIDGISSWYTAVYGHCHPDIVEAVARQLQKLDQVVFTGFTHPPAVELAERLLDILPGNQSRIFFNDNGSTAVEAAIKMALQFYYNKGDERDVLIAFENGFHGDTFGAMSASGLSVYNGPFEKYFLNVLRIPVPNGDNNEEVREKLRHIIKQHRCAAFVFEPLVQGAAGMKFHDPRGLDMLLSECGASDILCIADEVMTGFGKTGRNFACDHLEHQPDIMCLSKALTAGMIPMGITSCTQSVFEGFLDKSNEKGFFHAHTYSANPPACAAALAGLDLLASDEMQEGVARINRAHREFATKIEGHPLVRETRVMGVIFALELKLELERYGGLRDRLYRFYLDNGLFLRPLGGTIYILPPYVIGSAHLEKTYRVVQRSLEFIGKSQADRV